MHNDTPLAQPSNSQAIFAALRDGLAALYAEESTARVVVDDAGLDAKQITFSSRAQTNWHNILAEAIRQARLDPLLKIALSDYAANPAFLAAYGQYRLWIEQGGSLAAPALLPADADVTIAGDVNLTPGDFVGRDKYITGDEVHGNKIKGDQINAQGSQVLVNLPSGLVTQNFGPVTYGAPKSRVPMQHPPRATHFQGRQEDLAKLLVDLQPGQVVTLCGPGGIGKSALAAEAVWKLAPGAEPPTLFPDGILFYSFYNQPQAVFALEHIARSFGEETRPTPKASAQRSLAGRCALLVLDGTEQADNLSLVIDIRDQCGVLITSRARKDEVDKRQDVVPLPIEDAVALLQAWSGTRATDTTIARSIAEFVGRLPLALRIVGRYLAQSEEDASDYLTWLIEAPLAALNLGNRSSESIPLLLARSLKQVSTNARKALSIVGLLALAPFTPDIITDVLGLSAVETKRTLGELVNYGFLLRPTEIYEVTHALIHTYARLQLVSSVENMEQLAAYYATYMKNHKGEFNHLNFIRPHIMTLLDSCSKQKAWKTTSLLVLAVDTYLYLQGYWTDRIMVLETGLIASRSLQNRWDEGAFLGALGDTYLLLGYPVRAIDFYNQAFDIAREIGNRRNEGALLGQLGSSYADLDQFEKVIEYYEQALGIAKEIGNEHDESYWLGMFGIAYHKLNQIEKAGEFYQQALVIAKEIGDRWSEGNHLTNLGGMYRKLGQIEKAIEFHSQALRIAREIGHRQGEANNLGGLGNAYYGLGEMEQAIDHYQQALAITREIGDRRGEGTDLGYLGLAYANLGQVEQAISYYQHALTIAKQINDRRKAGNLLENLGLIYRDLGQVEQACQVWEQALRIFEEIKESNADKVRQLLFALQNQE